MEKRGKAKSGQLQMSFGMIFSIIIIAVTIAVSFYVISHFLRLNKCTELGFFYRDFENEVDKAWSSSLYQEVFEHKVPSNVDFVCFGNLTQTAEQGFIDEQELIKEDTLRVQYSHNLFVAPVLTACDGELSSQSVKHAAVGNFFCVKPTDGKIKVKITKESSDTYAQIMRAS